jgi:hypothetical protein
MPGKGFAARFIMWISIFNCEGARNSEEERLLRDKFAGGGAKDVYSLRTERHEVEGSCWFHSDSFYLSKTAADAVTDR